MSFGFHPPLKHSGREEQSTQQTASATKLKGELPCGMIHMGVASHCLPAQLCPAATAPVGLIQSPSPLVSIKKLKNTHYKSPVMWHLGVKRCLSPVDSVRGVP